MLSSKSKSGLSDVANNKNAAGSKTGRLRPAKVDVHSPSLQKTTSFSINGSPNSADSKPAVSRRSTKISTTPDKYSRLLKGSELQAQLDSVQEDLRKAKEKLGFEEREKANVLVELSDAKKAVEEVNEKLGEALLTLKKAEENSKLDKFRADETEQSAIEAARKREEKWHKELEDISNQHAVDVAALLPATQELQRVEQELAMAADAKKSSLRQADETMKIAEINTEKVEILSGEIDRLKSVLNSHLESKSNETTLVIKKLGSETEELKLELLKAKVAEEKLTEMEALVEGLKIELADVKKAESIAVGFVDEWKKKTELLESCLEKVKQSENVVQDSLVSLTKQLEESNSMLGDAESEVICLKEKAEALELEVERHKADLKESDHQLDLATQEVLDVGKTATVLKSEILKAEEVKAQALNNEKLRSSNMESLTHINNNLENELGITRENSEKSKKAMKGLASALHETSMEAMDLQERLLIKQAEVETVTGELDRLQLALKITHETYEVMLDEAKYEIVCLKKTIERSETEAKDSRAEWDAKEINLRSVIDKADEEITSIKLERDQAMEELQRKNLDANATVEAANKLHERSKCLRERLLEKEKELQRITQENDDLRVREAPSSEYGLHNILPKTIEVMDDNADESEIGNSEAPSEEAWQVITDDRKIEEKGAEGNPVKMEANICVAGETSDSKMPSESIESDSRLYQLNGHSVQNGKISTVKHQLLQRKKKTLLNKFGDILKKKSTSK